MRVVIIGAGPAGLATAACLKKTGADAKVLERGSVVGARWHNHYDRLVLHTARGRSGLPGLSIPDHWPRYPSRKQMVEYLESYQRHFEIDVEFGARVRQVERDGSKWRVVHANGVERCDGVVFATGLADRPQIPEIPGLSSFPGPVQHSSEYRNPSNLNGKRVLVLGFGNSGGDIALDLAEAGREVDVVVRGPVNLLPKELFGIPITSYGLLTRLLPYRTADALTAPFLRHAVGRPEDYGMVSASKGPAAQVHEDGKIPLIDAGALAAIRAGRIGVRPGVKRFEAKGAVFEDGDEAKVDAVVLATGYRVDLRPMLPQHLDVLDESGNPKISGARTDAPGLYFCSYVASANGQLRQMSVEAQKIAADLTAMAPS